MNWTSLKFILGFILILMGSLGVLVYFSAGGDIEKDINPVENLATEQG